MHHKIFLHSLALAGSFLLWISYCYSQINTFFVRPIQTNSGYTAPQDSHLVVRNTSTNLNKLFLFIGGTGSNTQGYQTLSNFAGTLGYDVLNLSYPNGVAAASLGSNPDSMVFNKYREEVCFGTPVSMDVTVDSLNSIYNRTVALITYLDLTYPTQNWNQYLINPLTLNWSKIAVGGHSQGSGHACYFAKRFDVERVLMFSGPNDYSNYYAKSANWLRVPGVTDLSKHYVYLSLNDEVVPFSNQLINIQGLGLFPLYDTTFTDIAVPPFNDSHCLYTKQAPGVALLYHNSTIKYSTINNLVWNYMLTNSEGTGMANVITTNDLRVYPIPASNTLNISSTNPISTLPYTLRDMNGVSLLSGTITDKTTFTLDISSLVKGFYLLTLGNRTVRVIKN
jgi:hypothetical protein